MTSLATENDTENNVKMRPRESISKIEDEKKIKMTSREDINALFPSDLIKKGEIHYFFNPFFDDTNTEEGTNESEYWGIRGIKNAYKALLAGGVKKDKIHLPFFASKNRYDAYKRKVKNPSPYLLG